ncbi:Mov34/MPN/PAD-1 family protein [Ramlibacter alkalitolerans]|uniref:Mov34/MPN/PAD-1 family protein n=1 Tax=Ramlibacter alkalitolerans TaxID=2039631 RepID=A0ABS1JX05_9BURK|nr:Mov34/MPN/PAD-1 family protein [Ramlibacter alkalitolerans]MBL0428744.1 Mov34/MPN/PAD-1 family protein [Ramlibacter alkalitolerans]
MNFVFQGTPYVFSESCLETLGTHRQRSCLSRETGGQLFARFEQQRVLVDCATLTRGKSKRSRFSFWPDREAERRDIKALFDQGLHYIGDWHTHPEARPTPSRPDTVKMQEVFRQSVHELEVMLLVIVGQSEFPDGLYVGAVATGAVTQLKPVP